MDRDCVNICSSCFQHNDKTKSAIRDLNTFSTVIMLKVEGLSDLYESCDSNL